MCSMYGVVHLHFGWIVKPSGDFVLQDGWSPLMVASEKGHLDVVMTLFEAGAEVNHTNKVVN